MGGLSPLYLRISKLIRPPYGDNMKKIIYNSSMLEKVCQDMFKMLAEKKSINVDYGEVYKDTTQKQLGFMFGGLIDSVISFYAEMGVKYTVDEVKNNFYQAVSYLDDDFRKKVRRFNGEEYEVPLRMSDMDRGLLSRFIDKCIWLIDNSKAFQGMKLAPDIRNTWIRHITQEDLRMINEKSFPYSDNEYMNYVHKQTCLVCGCHNGIEAHHLRIDNMGGTSKKPPDWMCVPLCSEHHRDYHLRGHEWFLEQVGWLTKYLTLKEYLVCNYYRWKNHIGG